MIKGRFFLPLALGAWAPIPILWFFLGMPGPLTVGWLSLVTSAALMETAYYGTKGQ